VTKHSENFAEFYCARRGVPPEQFEEVVLEAMLYPHARWMLFFDSCGWGDLLKAERDVLSDLGCAVEMSDISSVLSRLPWFYGKRWWLRNLLRLRISSRRVFAVARKSGFPSATTKASA
jgi:hypothetical protein